jgi:hypothetical protein
MARTRPARFEVRHGTVQLGRRGSTSAASTFMVSPGLRLTARKNLSPRAASSAPHVADRPHASQSRALLPEAPPLWRRPSRRLAPSRLAPPSAPPRCARRSLARFGRPGRRSSCASESRAHPRSFNHTPERLRAHRPVSRALRPMRPMPSDLDVFERFRLTRFRARRRSPLAMPREPGSTRAPFARERAMRAANAFRSDGAREALS